MVAIERRSFTSAQSAFAELGADTVPFAHLAKEKLKQLGTVLSNDKLKQLGRDPVEWRPQYGNSVGSIMSELLLNGDVAKLSNKTWKCVKLTGSTDVAFYSDSYHMKLDNATALESICSSNGLDVRIFEYDYPGLDFSGGYTPPSNVKVLGEGYRHMYRGKLVGFVMGGAPPHPTPLVRWAQPKSML